MSDRVQSATPPAPFVVPLKTAGASYRISVIDFTWKDGNSAG